MVSLQFFQKFSSVGEIVSIPIEAVEIIDSAKRIRYKLQGGGKLSNVDENGVDSLEFVVTGMKELDPDSVQESYGRSNTKQKIATKKSKKIPVYCTYLQFLKHVQKNEGDC